MAKTKQAEAQDEQPQAEGQADIATSLDADIAAALAEQQDLAAQGQAKLEKLNQDG